MKHNVEFFKKYYENATKEEVIEDMFLDCCEQAKEIERLNKKIEQYENPEDMTLMFMWCDEKAKDEIKRLNNIINELEKYCNEEIDDYDKNIKSQYVTDIAREQYEGEKVCFEDMLFKIQELKGSDKAKDVLEILDKENI